MKDKILKVVLDDVHQHEYLSHQCTNQPFYNSLATGINASGACMEFGGICEAISIPLLQLPPCNNQEERNCSLSAFHQALNEPGTKWNNEKTCIATEYRISLLDWKDNTYKPYEATYILEYWFQSKKSSGKREIKPFKTIHTEFLVWNEFTLVAYVGGMLGLTIGFSFPGMYEWIFEKFKVAWQYHYRSNKPKNKKWGLFLMLT